MLHLARNAFVLRKVHLILIYLLGKVACRSERVLRSRMLIVDPLTQVQVLLSHQ